MIFVEPHEIISACDTHAELIQFIQKDPFENEIYFIIRKGLQTFNMKVSKSIMKIVIKILTKMTLAHAIVIFPLPNDITIEEAASLLCVSDEYVVHLLKKGSISFHKKDQTSFIKLIDLLAYKQIKYAQSIKAVQELSDLWVDSEE